MIVYLVDRDALLQSVKQYIDECNGTLDGYENTQHILDLIENAPIKSSRVVKN